MQKLLWIVSLAALLAPACAASGANDTGGRATLAKVREPAFTDPEIVAEKSLPPRFTLVLQREMPTPGWRFEIDELQIDEEAGRILARITEVGPPGLVAQVQTRTACRLSLGMMKPGAYVVELWLRRSHVGQHKLAQVLMVDAR